MAARSCSITLFDGNKLSACHEIYYPPYPRGVADARPVRARKRKNPGHIRGPTAIYICRERRKGRRRNPAFTQSCKFAVCKEEKKRRMAASETFLSFSFCFSLRKGLPFCAVAVRGTRRYDDINLTCTRVHCYDNVFKCQPYVRARERAMARIRVHAPADAVLFADVSTRTKLTESQTRCSSTALQSLLCGTVALDR